LPARTEHIIPFHIIATGGCRLVLSEHEPARLNEGDAVLLPRGDSHRLSGREAAAAVQVSQLLPRLTELMFVETLRKYMQGLSADEVGWFAAFNDPVSGAALKFLHTDPLHDWNVENLARRVGVSRTVLAERFKHFLDQPPMQ
jgi:AraC family transcriptional regulator, alkane utilization regulator